MMPLFSIQGNKLTSLTGEVSSFYRLFAPDMDSQDELTQERTLRATENDFINTEGIFKIYWINENLYINSFNEFQLTHAKREDELTPIKSFLGREELNLIFYENYLTAGNDFLRVLSMKDYPQNIHLREVSNWPDFVMIFRKIPKLQAKQRINLKRKIHFSSLFKEMRDLDSENAYKQAEELFDDITTDHKALFKVEFFFILKASSKKELDHLTDETLYSFKGKGANLRIEEKGLSYFFQTLIPGVMPAFKRAMEMPSDFLSYLIPFHRDFVSNEGMELTSRSFNPVYFNLYDSSALNYNVLITGSSGQGKSMMANKLLMFELSRGTKGIVLDLGNSFSKNAKFHEGVILSQKFNPLQFRNTRYLKEFILSVMEEKLPRKEEGRMFEAIGEILKDERISSFSNFLNALEKDFKGISYYFKEIEEYFTDEILPLNDLTYCDFTLYPDSMKAPLIIYLIEYFKNLDGKKIFIFDECWHLLSKNADYIAECFRTFRKLEASAVAISQNLDDFYETQLGRVIVQNTFYKFLFRQSLSVSEFIDIHTKTLVDSVQSVKGQYSEFLLLTENQKKPLRFFPNPLEYELMTSAREDIRKFEAYMEDKGKYLDFKDAIKNFTEIKNPWWRDEHENI